MGPPHSLRSDRVKSPYCACAPRQTDVSVCREQNPSRAQLGPVLAARQHLIVPGLWTYPAASGEVVDGVLGVKNPPDLNTGITGLANIGPDVGDVARNARYLRPCAITPSRQPRE